LDANNSFTCNLHEELGNIRALFAGPRYVLLVDCRLGAFEQCPFHCFPRSVQGHGGDTISSSAS
jgi:hypothetical protein